MNINQSLKELEFRTGIRRALWILTTASIAANLILAVMAYSNKNTHRETLVPPNINKSFWVDGEKIAPEYLEQMGKFMLDLALNNSPLNCETNRVALLKYVGSGSYGPLNAQMSANCKLLQQNRLSNFFNASSVMVKESERAVVYTGSMIRWIGDKKLTDRAGSYRLKFGYSGGRIYLQELVEIDPRKSEPFSEQAVKNDVIEQMNTDMANASLEANETLVPATGTESRSPTNPASAQGAR